MQTGLTNGIKYYYVVTAVTASGESAASTKVNATPYGAPANVTATARDGNTVISWTAEPAATSYNIYWSTTPGVNKSSGNKIALANDPQTHTGLTNGTPYYYVVTAVNGSGETADSSEVNATPTAATAALDPLFNDQWNLKNTGQTGYNNIAGAVGEDIHVAPVWTTVTTNCPTGCKGDNVRIAIVDDGLEIGHEDLAANIAPTGTSYNYITGSSDPTNDPTDMSSGHGTSVAGIAAARDNNGLGGTGVAPRANLVGYNLLQSTKASDEADAMTHGSPDVSISSNSWGPADGTGLLYPSDSAWQTAIDTGLSSGRNNLGTIYTWAAGNGAPVDNSNYDGYANYRGVIAVTAVNDQGKESSYAEPGANIWIAAPGGEYCTTHAITTTDRTGAAGDNSYNDNLYGLLNYDYSNTNYTRCMNGTSSATPTVAGVVALMLQANPSLTWRDVRLILAQSARQNDPADPGWTAYGTTVSPYHFNHKYGFGVVDAAAAVAKASTWTNIGAEIAFPTSKHTPNTPIPDNNTTGVSDIINVSGSGISSIEYVEVTFSASDHPYEGDLAITLTSPSGTVSQLSETHVCLDPNTQKVLTSCSPAYNNWIFGSARHLGEAADGNWTLKVVDGAARDTGTFQSWGLRFYGH